MKTIWKFSVPDESVFSLSMPKDSKILTINVQQGDPFIFAMVDSSKTYEFRKFQLIGTGQDIEDIAKAPNNFKYIGTFFTNDETLVFHLFEEQNIFFG